MRTVDENMVNVQHERANEIRPTTGSDHPAFASVPNVEKQSTATRQPGATGQSGLTKQSGAAKLVVPLAVTVLSILVIVCFSRTLSSYFLADDFSEIWWVSEIFRGKSNLFWSTLAGNYMNVPGMSVWRPCLLTSLMCDYALWGTDARGYYLTNLLYFAGDVLLFYFVTRELLSSWTRWRCELTAFFAAALFAVSPLHCESISWVVGRVDIISCFYYLSSLLLLLKSRGFEGGKKRLLTAVSVTCFWVGLFTKEMAIGLPAIAALIGLLFPASGSATNQSRQSSELSQSSGSNQSLLLTLRSRVLEALRFSLPLWLSVLVYFPLRFLVLGTFVGGYVDGFGTAQMSAMMQKWLDPDIIGRLIYPLNLAVFGKGSIYTQALSACYVVAAGVIFSRALLLGLPWRWLVFLFGWAVTAAVPIFQLWGLGENLEGSRFYFYLTLPASLFLPVLLFAPGKGSSNTRAPGEQSNVLDHLNFKLSIVASLAMLALTATLFGAAYKSNLVWVHAGHEVRDFWESCKKLASTASEETRFVILGIPKEHSGAHQILNGLTFSTMLDAPFTSEKITRSFLTFDPIMYGAAEQVNDTRFKECLRQPGVRGPLVWNGTRKSFDEVTLSQEGSPQSKSTPIKVELLAAQTQNAGQPWSGQNVPSPVHIRGGASCRIADNKLVLEHVKPGDSLVFSDLDFNPMQFDFLNMGIKYKGAAGQPEIKVVWNNDPSNLAKKALSQAAVDNKVSAKVHLSHYWRWYSSPVIRELSVELFPCERAEIEGVTLVPSKELMPSMHVLNGESSPAGVYRLPEAGFLELVVEPDRVEPPNLQAACSSIEIEISKPNFFFANFADDRQATAVGTRIRLESGKTNFRLYCGTLPGKGFYDVRCRTLNRDGTPSSEYSNPVIVSKVH